MTISDANYKPSSGGTTYFKLKQGDNKIRVVSDIQPGYVYWNTDNKPVRSKTAFEKVVDIKPEGKIKDCWVFLVYNFESKSIQIAEITQMTIIQAMFDLENDEDWGNTQDYSINITGTGEGMERSYTVRPSPKKELPEDVKKMVETTDLNLDEMWQGKQQKRDEEPNPADDIDFD